MRIKKQDDRGPSTEVVTETRTGFGVKETITTRRTSWVKDNVLHEDIHTITERIERF